MNQVDELAFAKLLLVSRGSRTRREICKESGFGYQKVSRFEGSEYTVSIPTDSELSVLIRVYGLDPDEAGRAIAEAKKAKETYFRQFQRIEKNKHDKKKQVESFFPGSAPDSRSIRRMNPYLSIGKLSRS